MCVCVCVCVFAHPTIHYFNAEGKRTDVYLKEKGQRMKVGIGCVFVYLNQTKKKEKRVSMQESFFSLFYTRGKRNTQRSQNKHASSKIQIRIFI